MSGSVITMSADRIALQDLAFLIESIRLHPFLGERVNHRRLLPELSALMPARFSHDDVGKQPTVSGPVQNIEKKFLPQNQSLTLHNTLR